MDTIRKILFWCMILGFGVQLIWMVMVIAGGEMIYSFHSGLWQMDQMISKDFFYTANLVGIGMWKMAVILFFAIPWLGIKVVGT